MKRLAAALKSKQGFTMVEEIVASTLTVILLTAVAALLASCLHIYDSVKTTANGREVSGILLDKIAGEISGAQSAGTGGSAVIISKDGKTIAFSDRTGSPVYITCKAESADRQIVNIHYRPVKYDESSGQNVYDAVDWTFDPAMYMGFSVSSLTFAKVSGKNLVRISLTLSRGSYTAGAERYVECYNLLPDRIQTGTIPAD